MGARPGPKPKFGDNVYVQFWTSGEQFQKIEDYALENQLSRSEAVRKLIRLGFVLAREREKSHGEVAGG